MHFRFTTAGESHGKALVAIVEGIPAAAVERAIAMSHDKYCSASIMLGKTAEITTGFEVVEA